MSPVPVLFAAAFIAAAVPWALLAARRWGRLGVPVVVVAEALAVLGALVLSAAVRADAVVAVAGTLLALAVAGFVVLVRGGLRPWLVPDAAATWLPASLGGAIWLGALALAPAIPGSARLAWALNGDGFNNLWYAQHVILQGGVLLGGTQNPAPLTAALVALSGMPADPVVGGGAVEQEFAALAAAWAIALALWCTVSGAVVAALIPADRPAIVATAAAGGSLLPLAGFAGGLPIEWGYLNAALAIPLVLLGWLIATHGRRHPVVALSGLLVTATLLLATWAPLAALPAASAVVIAVRERRALVSLGGLRLVVLFLAVLQLVAFVGLQTLPSLLVQTPVLGTEGHGFPPTLPVALALLVAVPLAGRLLVRSSSGLLLASAIGGAVALAAVLLLARSEADPVAAYYPTKLAWLLAVVFATVLVAVAVAPLARLARAALPAVATACLAALAVAVIVPQPDRALDRLPLAMVLEGRMWHAGDASVERILALGAGESPALLWRSGDPDEGIIDFWVLVTNGGELFADPVLRSVAFEAYRAQRDLGGWQGEDPAQLCQVIERIPGLVVHSADPGLSDALAGCGAAATVVRTG